MEQTKRSQIIVFKHKKVPPYIDAYSKYYVSHILQY